MWICKSKRALTQQDGNFIHNVFFTFNTQVRTWNFPALVKYLTPLNGLYFSPYMSRRLTLRPVGRGGKQSEGAAVNTNHFYQINDCFKQEETKNNTTAVLIFMSNS